MLQDGAGGEGYSVANWKSRENLGKKLDEGWPESIHAR